MPSPSSFLLFGFCFSNSISASEGSQAVYNAGWCVTITYISLFIKKYQDTYSDVCGVFADQFAYR